MLAPKTRRNFARIIPFGVIWFLSGVVFFVVEQAAQGRGGQGALTGVDIDLAIFVFGTLALTGVGLLVGVFEVAFLGRALAKRSFPRKIAYKTVFYVLLFGAVTLLTFPIAVSLELDTSLIDLRVWERLGAYLTSLTHLSTSLQLAVALGVSLFYAEVSENIGHGVLINLVTGKYHRPTEETRIFLFSDMNASTSIAEKLGHVRYFELLKEYFADMSDAIVSQSGEVYQYVGDEIVVSWGLQAKGDAAACVRCFFAMKRDLAKRAGWYRETFGVVPTFKAGMHCGSVTTGEIGELKKDIIFTGDVLNATARIQALCAELEVDVLISGQLASHLDLEPEFQFEPLGSRDLRGRDEMVELFTILPHPQ
jgi:adenylate cyclase